MESSLIQLLMWSAACFVGLMLNNLLLVFDKLVFPGIDMSVVILVSIWDKNKRSQLARAQVTLTGP